MTNIHMRYFAKVLVGGVCLGQYVGFVPIEQSKNAALGLHYKKSKACEPVVTF